MDVLIKKGRAKSTMAETIKIIQSIMEKPLTLNPLARTAQRLNGKTSGTIQGTGYSAKGGGSR